MVAGVDLEDGDGLSNAHANRRRLKLKRRAEPSNMRIFLVDILHSMAFLDRSSIFSRQDGSRHTCNVTARSALVNQFVDCHDSRRSVAMASVRTGRARRVSARRSSAARADRRSAASDVRSQRCLPRPAHRRERGTNVSPSRVVNSSVPESVSTYCVSGASCQSNEERGGDS